MQGKWSRLYILMQYSMVMDPTEMNPTEMDPTEMEYQHSAKVYKAKIAVYLTKIWLVNTLAMLHFCFDGNKIIVLVVHIRFKN